MSLHARLQEEWPRSYFPVLPVPGWGRNQRSSHPGGSVLRKRGASYGWHLSQHEQKHFSIIIIFLVGGAFLQSHHLEGGGKEIRSSRLASVT